MGTIGAELIIGIIAGLLTVPILLLIAEVYQRFRHRRIRRFWKPFLGQKITLVMTEYPETGNDLSAQIVRRAADGFLVSKGSALALTNLLDFLDRNVTREEYLSIIGDKTGTNSNNYLIIIGSPISNIFSQKIFSILEERYDFPYTVYLDEVTGDLGLRSKDGKRSYVPQIQNGNGIDYAIIIKAKYRSYPSSYVIIVGGVYMYGTQAGSRAIFNREILNCVCENSNNAENLVFLLKTNIVNHQPAEAELEFGNEMFIHPLVKEQAKNQIKK